MDHAGTGYIRDSEDPEKDYLVDASVLHASFGGRPLTPGQHVTFRCKNLFGAKVAVDVRPT